MAGLGRRDSWLDTHLGTLNKDEWKGMGMVSSRISDQISLHKFGV